MRKEAGSLPYGAHTYRSTARPWSAARAVILKFASHAVYSHVVHESACPSRFCTWSSGLGMDERVAVILADVAPLAYWCEAVRVFPLIDGVLLPSPQFTFHVAEGPLGRDIQIDGVEKPGRDRRRARQQPATTHSADSKLLKERMDRLRNNFLTT